MYNPDPPAVTPDHVRERLRQGRPVMLEEPGWADVGAGPCPDCGRICQQFRQEPGLRFHYGSTCAYPHRCRDDREPALVPAAIRRRELAEQMESDLYRRNEWPPESGTVLDWASHQRERDR